MFSNPNFYHVTLCWTGKIVDSPLSIEYINPVANPLIRTFKINNRLYIYFEKNNWQFSITTLDNNTIKEKFKRVTYINIRYTGNENHPNLGFARWYFFIMTGRRVEFTQKHVFFWENKVNRVIHNINRHHLPRL